MISQFMQDQRTITVGYNPRMASYEARVTPPYWPQPIDPPPLRNDLTPTERANQLGAARENYMWEYDSRMQDLYGRNYADDDSLPMEAVAAWRRHEDVLAQMRERDKALTVAADIIPTVRRDEDPVVVLAGATYGDVPNLEQLRDRLASQGIEIPPEIDDALDLERRSSNFTHKADHLHAHGPFHPTHHEHGDTDALTSAREALALASEAFAHTKQLPVTVDEITAAEQASSTGTHRSPDSGGPAPRH